MNRLHIESMAQDKSNPFLRTEIREPIPREHTLNPDDYILSIRSNDTQKCLRRRGQIFVDEFCALLIEDTHVPRLCM